MFLEDSIPLLREIYLFDPTFHNLFKKWIIGIGAVLYRIDQRTFIVIPYGIYQKIEDALYCILKIKIKGDIRSTIVLQDGEFVYRDQHSLYIQYYFCPTLWKVKCKEYESLYKHSQIYLSRHSYINLVSMQTVLNT